MRVQWPMDRVDPRRALSFGEIADTYDRIRPSYPTELVDDVLNAASTGPRDRAVEVGAGTGKATVLFVARGLDITAVEPDAAMAKVARELLAGTGVEFVVKRFEDWSGPEKPVPLVYAAQSWHWVDQEVGLRRAHETLRPGGVLALFWNSTKHSVLNAVGDAYRRHAPDLDMRRIADPVRHQQRLERLAAAEEFGDPEDRVYEWSRTLTSDALIELVSTYSDHRLLDPEVREALFSDVRASVDAGGGSVDLPSFTRLYLVRRLS